MEKSVSSYTVHQVLISKLNRHSHGTTGALTNIKILLHLKLTLEMQKACSHMLNPSKDIEFNITIQSTYTYVC